MSCYHPLRAFRDVSGNVNFVRNSIMNDEWLRCRDNFLTFSPSYGSVLALPCRQCIGCRLDYSHDWAVRCLLEAKMSIPESCYFLTLTYEDSCIPDSMRSFSSDIDTGEVLFPTLTLDKKELQDFMKLLRYYAFQKYGVEGIRFYACGEYGTKSMRPHFHLILFNFNVPDSDLHEYRYVKSQSGMPLLESDIVNLAWKKGLAPIGRLSYNSACYTAGYMLKKVKGPSADDYYKSLGIIPEFSLMSRMPGLARSFYEKYSDYIYENDRLNIHVGNRAVAPRPPSYFDKLYVAEHGEGSLDSIKSSRLHSAILSKKASFERQSSIDVSLNLPIDELFQKKESIVLENVTRGLSLTL